MALLEQEARIFDFPLPEEAPADDVFLDNVFELPRPITLDRLPTTPDLNTDALIADAKATDVGSPRHSQANFNVYSVNRYGNKLGDVVAHHPKRDNKHRISRVDLEFTDVDSENLGIRPQAQNIDPADNHSVLLKMIGPLIAASPELRTIGIPFSEKTMEDPDGLKLPGAGRELELHGLLPEGWEFKLLDENGEARFVFRKKPALNVIGSTALRTHNPWQTNLHQPSYN